MKRQTLAVIGVIILLLTAVTAFKLHSDHVAPVQVESKASATAVTPPTRAELLTLVNAERAKNGVQPLTEDSRLDQSAQMKADDEVTYKYTGHISPDNSPYAGLHGYKLIDTTGLMCVIEGENLTENIYVNDSKHAVDAWIASPEHHAAMIDSKYSLTGFGIDKDQIVEHFCQVQ